MPPRETANTRMMRAINRSAVLDVIREEKVIARTQIAERLGVSLPTVMRIVDELIADDLVRPHGSSQSSGGRPRALLEYNARAHAVVGVDLGGTKMFGTVADLAGTIQTELYSPWGEDGVENSLDRLCKMIAQLLDAPRPARQKIRGIGVGAPGITLDEEGIVTWAPSLGWRDLPLKQMLTERFHLPIFVENDVNLATLGEWSFGAGRNTRNMVCIAIGTGIGAGIIVDGALYRGSQKAAGEIGYLLPGPDFLGRRYDEFGALESLASGTGIAARARRRLGRKVTAEQVFAAARRGAAWALDVVRDTVDYLALAVASTSCLLNPELGVLGGGVSQSADLLLGPIQQRLQGTVPFVPRLAASSLGPRAAVMGAITLVLNETEHITVRRLEKRRKTRT